MLYIHMNVDKTLFDNRKDRYEGKFWIHQKPNEVGFHTH